MTKLWPVGLVVLVFGAVGMRTALKPSIGGGADAVAAQARLDAVPLALGDWAGVPTPVPPKQLRIAEAQAHLSRTYTHAKTGTAVSVLVLYGEPGPLGAHTPETCYAGAGFRQLGSPATYPVGGSELWTTRFETPATPPAVCRVAWGWGTGTTWRASASPRVDFAAGRRIYKLYAARTIPAAGPDGTAADPPTDALLTLLLPALAADGAGNSPTP